MPTRSRMIQILVALIVITPLALLGASAHYKKGGQPVCTVSGFTATCSPGEVAGLGNFNVLIIVTLTAAQDQICFAPGDKDQSNPVQGQNPALSTSATSLPINANEIKNGSLIVPEIIATATLTPSSATVAGCPNPNWTVTLDPDDPPTISGSYVFQSPPGTTIDKLSFTF